MNNIKYTYNAITFSEKCGCYSCKKIFSPNLITETTHDDTYDDEVGICPFCKNPTVVSSSHGDITDDTIQKLYDEEYNKTYKKAH